MSGWTPINAPPQQVQGVDATTDAENISHGVLSGPGLKVNSSSTAQRPARRRFSKAAVDQIPDKKPPIKRKRTKFDNVVSSTTSKNAQVNDQAVS